MNQTVWSAGQKVVFTSRSGNKYDRIIEHVSSEGFAVIKEGESDILFGPSGMPVNDTYDEMVKGPRIQKTQESDKKTQSNQCDTKCKSCKELPWCMDFMNDNFSIRTWREFLSLVDKFIGIDEILDLKKIKEGVKLTSSSKYMKLFDRERKKLK